MGEMVETEMARKAREAEEAAKAAKATPANLDEAFEMVRKAVVDETDPEIGPQLEAALERMNTKPPIKSISAVLGRDVEIDEVRRMLFMPDGDSMKTYVKLIRGAAKAKPRMGDDQP